MVSPGFDLQGGYAVCAARGLGVGALLSAFGSLVFRNLVAPQAFARMAPDAAAQARRRLLHLTQASTLTALFGYALWLLIQTRTMADSDSLAASAKAVPTVLTDTSFGHVIIGQFIAVAMMVALVGWRDRAWRQRAALGAAALAVALQAGHSHAYSMYGGPSLLLWCDVLHLFGAGAWLGGLAPLILLVSSAPGAAGAVAARCFSPLGKACIAALVLSAGVQGWVLVASIPGLVGTAYGWMVLVKLALFAVLLGFAAANRYRFAPALLQDRPDAAKHVLVRSIVLQTGVAIAIIAAAVVLSELPPSMHEQPLWPFADRFSLAAINEDPDFRREVIEAGLALAGAAGVVAMCLALRRFRLAAGALAAITAWFAIPHLDLLLVTAYPTSFYHSPTGFASASIDAGRTLYAQNCVACHGATGHGDGPAAKTLPVPPADLTADHLWMHSDGELFWWLTHGMQTPEGAAAMPGFASILDQDQRWSVIDFIRARNAGDKMAATGTWTMSLQAPGFDAVCGQQTRTLHDMRGTFVLLRFGAAAVAPRLDGVVTITVGGPGPCTSTDETVPAAYAIVAGLDASHLQGMDFLIDDYGLLRTMQRAGPASAALAAEIRTLRAHPVAEAAPPPMNMPM
jgi:putative copper export protein/mono/diheme cytochrome c family protein